jgi:hypothetical protein
MAVIFWLSHDTKMHVVKRVAEGTITGSSHQKLASITRNTFAFRVTASLHIHLRREGQASTRAFSPPSDLPFIVIPL